MNFQIRTRSFTFKNLRLSSGRGLISVFLVLITSYSFGSPWIEVGNERIKHSLHYLNDSGVISIPLTTWPIMWVDVKAALDQVEKKSLNMSQKLALKELEFEMRYQTRQGVKRSVAFSISSSRPLLRDFSSSYREQGEFHHTYDWDGQDLAVKVRANIVSDPGEDKFDSYFDGSYFAGVAGEWVLGIGAIDRWWGPGNQASLILSNNARPVPGLILRTKGTQSFETPLLSWIGDWHFTSFLGQMDSTRVIPKAKLTGMRFAFKPFPQLEFGLSRTMQWGGDGRSEGLTTFWKSLTSQDENNVDGSGAGNQLAGYDIRYSFSFFDAAPSAIYAQTIGEDEAGYLPARRTAQMGFETAFETVNANKVNAFIEYSNSTADAFGSKRHNVAYEHSVYQTGYRYRGRAIATSFDNDSEVVTLGSSLHLQNGQLYKVLLSYLKLNKDGVAAGNTISSRKSELYFVQLMHQREFMGGWLKLELSYLSEQIQTSQLDVDQAGIFGAWEYRY